MKVKFSRCNSSDLISLPIVDGQLVYVKDTDSNFLDVGNVRNKITDIVFINTEAEFEDIENPLQDKFYFVKEAQSLNYYNGSKFEEINSMDAEEIPFESELLTSTTVQDAINEIKTDIDNTDTNVSSNTSNIQTNANNISTLQTQVASLLTRTSSAESNISTLQSNVSTIQSTMIVDSDLDALRSDINSKLSTANASTLIKQVTYNSTTATLTFTAYDNSTTNINLPIESTFKSGRYDSNTKKLILVLVNDTEIEIPVSDLIDVYTGGSTSTISVSVSAGNVITANVNNGSITDDMLATDVKNKYATNTALNDKVDKVSGKGLSSNDYTTEEKSKLAGIATGANNYTLPKATGLTLGGIKVGNNLSIDENGVLSSTDTNTTYNEMIGASSISDGQSGLVPQPGTGDQVKFLRGDATWQAINIPTYNNASTENAGLMSSLDKAKLDGISEHANNYTLPTASSITKGGIKVGNNLSIDANGVLSATDTNTTYTPMQGASAILDGREGLVPQPDAGENLSFLRGDGTWATINEATTSNAGLMSSLDKSKLNNIAENANNYTLPTASANTKGGIKVGTNLSIDANGVLSATDTTYDVFTPPGQTSPIADGKSGLVPGSIIDQAGFILTTNGWESPSNVVADVIPSATTSRAGLMSASDKTKLNGIQANANNYTLPTATSQDLGGIKIGNNLTIDNDGVVSATNTTYNEATTSVAGLMSALDKSNLESLITDNTQLFHWNGNTEEAGKAFWGEVIRVSKTKPCLVFVEATLNTVSKPIKSYIYFDSPITISASGTCFQLVPTLINNPIDVKNSYSELYILQANLTLYGTDEEVTSISLITNTAYTLDALATNINYSTPYTPQYNGSPATKKYVDDSVANVTVNQFTGATGSLDGTSGTVPAPLIADRTKFLKGDGTWDTPTDTTYNEATTSTSGLMSSSDKSKLDGIANNANNYTLPNAGVDTLGGIKVGTNLSIDASGVLSATDTTYSEFVGTGGDSAGAAGLVPGPGRSDYNKFLKGDGTWSAINIPAEKTEVYYASTTGLSNSGSYRVYTATCEGFTAQDGDLVVVKINTTNSVKSKVLALNINNTGAIPVYYKNQGYIHRVEANTVLTFILQNNQYLMLGDYTEYRESHIFDAQGDFENETDEQGRPIISVILSDSTLSQSNFESMFVYYLNITLHSVNLNITNGIVLSYYIGDDLETGDPIYVSGILTYDDINETPVSKLGLLQDGDILNVKFLYTSQSSITMNRLYNLAAMQGATALTNGRRGYVPAPNSGDQGKYLKGDGTWDTPENTTYSVVTTSTNGLMSSSDKTKLDGIATGATANAASNTTPKAHGIASVGTETTFARGDHVHPAQTNITGNAATATALETPRYISLEGAVTGEVQFDGTANRTITTTLAGFDASKITTGTIDVGRLPAAAVTTLKVVADDTARFALTTTDVQKGDCVKVTSTSKLYMVKDDTKLDEAAGYEEFSAGNAATADHATTADTASALSGSPTIAITGGATAAATTFTGSSNISLNVTSLDATKLSGTTSINTTGNAATATNATNATTATNATNVTTQAAINNTEYSILVGNKTAGNSVARIDSGLAFKHISDNIGGEPRNEYHLQIGEAESDAVGYITFVTSTGKYANIVGPNNLSENKAYHLPDASGTFVLTTSTQALTNKTYNGYTLADACAKSIDTSISNGSTSLNLPTSKAVNDFVVGKGYKTTDTNYYPTTWTWANGTTEGPTAILSGEGMSNVSIAAIPAANGVTTSGIVTTGAQTFGGVKTFASSPKLTSNSLTTSGGYTISIPNIANTIMVTTDQSQALTNKTYNGLVLTSAETGFTISGGTTSKTLIVNSDITLAEAASKAVDTSISSDSTSTNVPTSAAVATFVSGISRVTSVNNISHFNTCRLPVSSSGANAG